MFSWVQLNTSTTPKVSGKIQLKKYIHIYTIDTTELSIRMWNLFTIRSKFTVSSTVYQGHISFKAFVNLWIWQQRLHNSQFLCSFFNRDAAVSKGTLLQVCLCLICFRVLFIMCLFENICKGLLFSHMSTYWAMLRLWFQTAIYFWIWSVSILSE